MTTRAICFCIAVLVLVAVVSTTSIGQDLTSGTDSVISVTPGIYIPDADGTQDWIREYDGRSFTLFGLEEMNLLGYNGPLRYRLDTRDLTLGDEDVDLILGLKNKLGINLSTSRLTHRLERTPAVNPFLVGTPAEGGDDVLDLSPNIDFLMDRRVNDFGIGFQPWGPGRVRFVANYWQEFEKGRQQVLFRARAASPLIGNRVRGAAAIPIDRTTQQNTIGADVSVGSAAVVNYRYSNTKHGDEGNRPDANDPLSAVFALNSLTRISTETDSNVFKARAKITEKLYFTGVHTNRKRSNNTAPLIRPVGAGVKATNAALTFLATDTLTLTGRYRDYELSSRTAPLLDEDTPENQTLSKDQKQFELEAAYSGIPLTFLRFNFERRDNNRAVNPLHPEHEEFEHPFTSGSSDYNIWRAKFRYYPTLRLNISGGYEDWNGDNAGYTGEGDSIKKTNLSATYMLTDALAIYGDYSRWDEENTQIRVPFGDIPTPATDEEEEALRNDAAGQGFRNKLTTTNIGAWYALSSKLMLDANLSWIDTDAAALWILGLDPAFLPHLLPDYAPYEATNKQWSLGATYAVTPKWRVFGRYLASTSDGKSLIDPGIFPDGIGPTWQPVDVEENRWTLGFAHDLNARNTLSVDFSLGDWEDQINAANDGRFKLWRFAWKHDF